MTTDPPSKKSATTARTSVLRVHRERAQEKHSLPIEPRFTLLVAPGFQGEGIDDALIHAICKNDGITPITIDNLARLVELFPFRNLSPAKLRPLFDLTSPDTTAAWVAALEETKDAPEVAPLGAIINAIVKSSGRKDPLSVASLSTAVVYETDRDLGEDVIESIVRSLLALAPRSLYFDGTAIALNTSPEAFLAELVASIEPIDPAVSEVFRTVLNVS